MKTKILSLILTLILVVSLVCSCSHEHYFYEEYSHDDANHWFECGGCGEKKDVEEHTWDGGSVTLAPTENSEGERTFTCTVCGHTKVEKIDKLNPDHTHVYNKTNSDANGHWKECYCGAKDAVSLHNWDEGVVTKNPTVDEEGKKVYTCDDCKYQKTETIDKLGADHTHTYNEQKNDEYSHWNECVCGAKDAVADHTWDNGVVASGVTTYTCTECGRKYAEATATATGMSFLQSTHYRMNDRLEKNPLTLEAEIYVPTTITGRAGAVFSNYMGIRQDWHFEICENGAPRFYYVDANGNIRDYKFTNVDVRGKWVRIAFTFDYANKTMSVYLDGELAQTMACDYDLAPDATRYKFLVGGDGRSDNSQYFKGQIRSIAVYSDVRTAEEIAQSAQNGTNVYADDLLVAYQLNENSAKDDIIDLSGNGYEISKEWLDSHTPDIDYAYSFAAIGDTQWLSKYTPEKMEGIYDWLIANKDSKKISHVFGLGDITEDWYTANKEQEWIRAQQYIYKLNGVIPYSVIRGNHDESIYFNKYFATEEYMSQHGAVYMNENDVRTSYKLVRFGSTDYMFLTLDYGASTEVLEWANEVVLAHPNHRVIVTTHGYQGFDGGHLNDDNTPIYGKMHSGSDVDTTVGNNNRDYNTGEEIWNKFISQHPNIFLVMSGHTPDEDILLLQTKGVHGNVVNQMLIDPQWIDPQKGGAGMVCMLYFSEDGSQMAVEWICSDTGKYYKEKNQFTIDLTDSFNAPAHSFSHSYNESYHYMACACGYTYDEEAHVFDGGVINSDGYMVYSCECGYQRIASATNDPTALALQDLLEKHYQNGVYYKETIVGNASVLTFYNGDKFWENGTTVYYNVSEYLTLKDIILGKYGDLKLDLGWNELDGVYTTANADTVQGISSFVNAGVSGVTKVTIEENGALVVIKLWAGDSLAAQTELGAYVTTTLVNHEGETLDTLYNVVGANYMCEVTTPTIVGYVAEYDKFIVDSRHMALTKTVYYSTVDLWDGTSVSTSLKGSGTEADPYLVESGADLMYIANKINALAAKETAFSGKYFKMTQSINLNGHELYIGSFPAWDTRKIFGGVFDGNHCTIRGLNNTKSLFGAVEGGAIKNLSVYGTVKAADAAGNRIDEATGGIVAYVAGGGILENLTNYVTVTGASTLGGVVGNSENNASTVMNCVNYGNVTGTKYIIGGIVGSGGHNITGCFNYGNVAGGDEVGGIAGTTKNTGSINNCYNYGTLSGGGKVAGIAGVICKPITDCINYGNVNGTWSLGGIAGWAAKDANVTISGCANFGNVTGSSTAIGGIFGLYEGEASATGTLIIKNCTNNGSVLSTGSWGVGGIVADGLCEISGCVNNGNVKGVGQVGGIIGKCYGKVTKCTNNGNVVGTQDIIGGIVGHLHVATHVDVINTTNTQNGTVTGPNSKDIIGQQG